MSLPTGWKRGWNDPPLPGVLVGGLARRDGRAVGCRVWGGAVGGGD